MAVADFNITIIMMNGSEKFILVKTEQPHILKFLQQHILIRENDNKIIGTIQLRHELNNELKKCGGHIGFGIRPSERQKGYATKQLSLVLNEAKKLGIQRVMISCDKDNIASSKVTINNGGVLEWEGYCEVENNEIQLF